MVQIGYCEVPKILKQELSRLECSPRLLALELLLFALHWNDPITLFIKYLYVQFT